MNHPRLSARHLGLAFSALGLALLTACGGGGGAADPTSVAAPAAVDAFAQLGATDPVGAPPPAVAAPAAVQNLCGVDAVSSIGDFSFSEPSNATMVINGYSAPIALLTSSTGYPFNAGTPTRLNLPMSDLREVASQGLQTVTTNTMGVEVSSPFDAASVACVAGVIRVLPGTDNLGNAIELVSLSSAAVTNLPVDIQVQDGQPALKVINGFEFMHNFTAKPATAVFRMSTSALADPTAARICRLADTVTCSAADAVEADTGHWVLRSAVSAPGVYLLVAGREMLALD